MRHLSTIAATLLATLLVAACGGTEDAPTGPAATTGAPTLTLAISAARLRARSDSGQLTWSTTNASACTPSGGWTGAQATNGSSWIKPTTTGSVTYALDCTGEGGTVSKCVAVAAWLPVPVAATSYENWKPNGPGEIAFHLLDGQNRLAGAPDRACSSS